MDMVTFVRESSVSPEEMLMKSTTQLGFLVGKFRKTLLPEKGYSFIGPFRIIFPRRK